LSADSEAVIVNAVFAHGEEAAIPAGRKHGLGPQLKAKQSIAGLRRVGAIGTSATAREVKVFGKLQLAYSSQQPNCGLSRRRTLNSPVSSLERDDTVSTGATANPW